MRLRLLPARAAVWTLLTGAGVALLLLIGGIGVRTAWWLVALAAVALAALAAFDYLTSRAAWRNAAVSLTRRLPNALAIGVRREVLLQLEVAGTDRWSAYIVDHADPSLQVTGSPFTATLQGGKRSEFVYSVTPTRRGEVEFRPADVLIRSRLGLWELIDRLGPQQRLRVFPDFAQVARYAWLAGDRRLSEIGIKTFRQRGEGTDFKQLTEYRIGDPVRHIDWKATLRFERPIVREFQNERDQCVLLLIDCGRRMRADERSGDIGSAHFDQILNAVMLLTYVALKDGDAVGALTFGTPPGEERWFAPRKGTSALNALMGELYSVQPSPTHSDYLAAARELLRRYRKRALVIVITNFRDEDASELSQALTLLRSKHLVLPASLREKIVGELASQPLTSTDAALEVAGAHLYEQARTDAFRRLAARNALMVDAEPERLGIELVNRYQAAKRAGVL